MTFQAYSQAEEAAAAIIDYLMDRPDPLPDGFRHQLREFVKPGNSHTGTSVSFTVAYTVELTYSWHKRFEDIPASFLELVAGCCPYCVRYGVDNLGGGRGDGIMQALRRDAGEAAPLSAPWPAPESDPEPGERFMPPLEEEVPAGGGGGDA